MKHFLWLFLVVALGGCDVQPSFPQTPPLFTKGDKVRVTLPETNSTAFGIVIDVNRIPNKNSMSNGFHGWRYQIMFPDTTIIYNEDQLTLYEKIKWSDDKPPSK